MIDIQIKPQIKAIKLIIFHKRDASIAQGGYLDTCRDYRLPSLNFGKKPKCSGIYLGNIQKSIAKASKSVSTLVKGLSNLKPFRIKIILKRILLKDETKNI